MCGLAGVLMERSDDRSGGKRVREASCRRCAERIGAQENARFERFECEYRAGATFLRAATLCNAHQP